MHLTLDHPWTRSPRAAAALQSQLRARVVLSDCPGQVRYVAGIDVGFEEEGQRARAAVAVLELPKLTLIDFGLARARVRFPYIPGLLSFRELPVILKALRELQVVPDLLVCDGHGYAHPRRFGLACHLGVVTGLRSIGVAKSRLVGAHGPIPVERGAWTPLIDRGERVGAVVRSRAGVQPIYVSIGHCVSLARAVRLTMDCVGRYRLPETTRWAHRLASTPANALDRLVPNLVWSRALRGRRASALPDTPAAR